MLQNNETKNNQNLASAVLEESKQAKRDVIIEDFPKQPLRTGTLIFDAKLILKLNNRVGFHISNTISMIYIPNKQHQHCRTPYETKLRERSRCSR